MSIWLNDKTKVIVQGMTGREGTFHTGNMIKYGTNVVAGVTPGKGGDPHLGLPIFDNCLDAVQHTGATASVIFVPARFCLAAVQDAVDSGVKFLVVITEGIPLHDEIKIGALVRREGVIMVGPNCPGIFSVGQASMGIMPSSIFKKGNIGLVSRSGTLTYELVDLISRAGLGISTAVGIGGDRVIGARFIETLKAFDDDQDTLAVAMVGEIGGSDEEEAAEMIPSLSRISNKIVGFIGGRTAPPGKAMGHAGAIVEGNKGTPQSKVEALESIGVPVPEKLSEMPDILKGFIS